MGKAMAFFFFITLVFINSQSIPAAGGDTAGMRAVPASGQGLAVDGSLDDRIWRSAEQINLTPAEQGVPPRLGGTVKLVVRGGHLCLAAFLPEPGGRVVARSIGYNPVWEQDAVSSPVVEDRLIIDLASGPAGSCRSALKIEINPRGACRLERDGQPVPASGILAAARISADGWYVECALPLDELYQGDQFGELGVAIARFRSRRPLDPQFLWKSSAGDEYTRFRLQRDKSAGRIGKPAFDPPEPGNTDPALRSGKKSKASG